VNADGSGLHRVPLADAHATAPEFSPDGRLLAYIEDHHSVVVIGDAGAERPAEVYRIDLFDQNPLTPTGADNLDVGPFAVHWSPDASLLLVTRQRTGGSGYTDVLVMKPDGSERRTLLDAEQLVPSSPEATWSASHAPDPRPPPLIVVVGGSGGVTNEVYDLQGNKLPEAAYPAKTIRIAVATHQNPGGEGVLVTSSAGSPEPFGPIEVYDITGAGRIVGGGCGAAWSPDGTWITYYDGFGIATQRADASPEQRTYVVRNADMGQDASSRHPELCVGAAITWRDQPFIDSPE
jgi:hypothetical protein